MINQKELLAPERHERLKSLLKRQSAVRVDELCEALQVSSATIRRDLETLERQGVLRRVHGGAVRVENRLEEPLFDDKTSIAAAEKLDIARRAAELVDTGDTVYLDGGSTVLELARILSRRSDITVVTNSLRSAVELSGSGPEVILVGGALRRRSQTMVGSLTRLLLDGLHVDKAFMGTIGMSIEEGITTTDPDEAFTKEQVMRQAERCILLADSGKEGKVSFARSSRLEDFDVMISDPNLSPDFVQAVETLPIELLTV